MYTILRRNARDIRSVGSKRFGMEVLLRGVYVHGDLFYLHVLMRNRSKVAFDIDYIRFKVCDRKTARRTAVQETFVNPVRVFDEITRVDAEAMVGTYLYSASLRFRTIRCWSWRFTSGAADVTSISKSKTSVWSERARWMN